MSVNNENEKMNNSNAEKKFTKVTARDNKKRCKSHIEYDVVRFGDSGIIGQTCANPHKQWTFNNRHSAIMLDDIDYSYLELNAA